MKHLKIHNPRFITYKDDFLTVDVLGGVDTQQIERMICTLRITYENYPPLRSTLDLYNDNGTDKLIRTLCDKWNLTLTDTSKSVHRMIAQLETYKLDRLKYPKNKKPDFTLSEEETKTAKNFLKDKNLTNNIIKHLNTIGILGEDENALILFLSLASHKFSTPFSTVCLAKSGIGKSYILQKLSECMPEQSYSFHTKITANALYYFDSGQLTDKALFIEDLEWTTAMLQPLATLQTQGKLISTKATKDKDGMLHSSTFEVAGKLCLLACAYSDKNFEEISLPFLCLHLNHSHKQDLAIMDYQKRCKAGQIKDEEVTKAKQLLKNIIATLENVTVINPYATLINLPDEIAYPRKSMLLLLNFIEVITYFFQYQRSEQINETTGEVSIITHPEDIELAFKLLKNNLFRRSDELTTSARGFYNWLNKHLTEAKTTQFTALDIRKEKPVHPRTLNRYLQELKLFGYVQVVGGNKHRGGFIYKLTGFGNQKDRQSKIQQSIDETLKNVWSEYENKNGKQKNQKPETNDQKPINKPSKEENKTIEPPQSKENRGNKRVRIEEKEKHTLKIILELEKQEPEREYLPSDLTTITKRSYYTESRHLKTLWEQGKLNREWKNRQYHYTLIKPTSKTVSQKPMTDTQSPSS